MSDFRFNSGFIQPNYFLPPPNYNVPPPPFSYQNSASIPPASLARAPPAPTAFNQNFFLQSYSVPGAQALGNLPTFIPNAAQPLPAFGTFPDVRQPPPAIRSAFDVRQPPPFISVPEVRLLPPAVRPPGAFPLNCPPPSIPSSRNNTNSTFSPVSSQANGSNANGHQGFLNNGYNSSRCISPRPVIPVPPRLCFSQLPYSDQRGGGFKNHRQGSNVTNGANQLSQGKRQYAHGGTEFTNNSKRQKIDKRDLPENNRFCCEVCDRGFKTEETFQVHVGSHVKCTAEGCKYVAHPKLVKLHYETQHRTGLAKKIWSLQSKEDLEKWKEERKRNYPTAENIERKKKEKSDRWARGEVMENKYFGRMRGGRGADRGRGFRGRGGKQRYTGRGWGCDRESSRSEENEVENVSQLVSSSDQKVDNESAIKRPTVDIDKDDGDDDDDDDGPPCVSTSRQEPLDRSKVLQDNDKQSQRNEIINGLSPLNSKSLTTAEKSSKQQNRRRKVKDKQINKRMQKDSSVGQAVRRRPALLERLLTNEIRHERNMVLQCVRYLASKMSETDC